MRTTLWLISWSTAMAVLVVALISLVTALFFSSTHGVLTVSVHRFHEGYVELGFVVVALIGMVHLGIWLGRRK